MAEPLPRTADGWAEHYLDRARRAFDEMWAGAMPADERRYLLTALTIDGTIVTMLWEALRLADPEAADRLAAEVADLCDAGDEFGELLYEWRWRLDAGRPLSGSQVYRDVWQRVGLAVPAYGVATDG